ncbi:NAD(P)-binding protein [Clathrospora elynae]|uniref:NAD(P)-binding protein n=1 Tax=Clathrospora elynae TaxID=706981 RepID=A0A6A5T226_9PLEO|nr:NAD(P)-binding protein [Clathrospora elynae]
MSTYETSILVTGGTQGMGYHTTLALAQQCPSILIVIASRTDPDNAAISINRKLGQSNVKFMPLDLSSLAKVRDCAKRWGAENHPPIQALVLNAAIQLSGDIEYTDDGIEKHFAVNHVGHALLFHLLVPSLTHDARIVVVSSGVHDVVLKWGLTPAYTTPEEVARPSPEAVKKSGGRDRYATSKVANVLWTLALGRHLSSHPVHKDKTVVALDPGLMFPTRLTRDASWLLQFLSNNVAYHLIPLLRVLINSNINGPAESGGNLAWLAVGKEVHGLKGVYFEKRREHAVSEQAQSQKLQEGLWRWTVERVAGGEEERERFARVE